MDENDQKFEKVKIDISKKYAIISKIHLSEEQVKRVQINIEIFRKNSSQFLLIDSTIFEIVEL